MKPSPRPLPPAPSLTLRTQQIDINLVNTVERTGRKREIEREREIREIDREKGRDSEREREELIDSARKKEKIRIGKFCYKSLETGIQARDRWKFIRC